jgi:hypothetical protein
MELEVSLHTFLTLVLDEEGCSASQPSHSTHPLPHQGRETLVSVEKEAGTG